MQLWTRETFSIPNKDRFEVVAKESGFFVLLFFLPLTFTRAANPKNFGRVTEFLVLVDRLG